RSPLPGGWSTHALHRSVPGQRLPTDDQYSPAGAREPRAAANGSGPATGVPPADRLRRGHPAGRLERAPPQRRVLVLGGETGPPRIRPALLLPRPGPPRGARPRADS